MVTITGYATRQRKDGTSFIVLMITSGVELVQSQSSGQWRAVVRKTTIPASFDEQVAKSVVGTQLPGSIVRVQCDSYQLTNEQTGEVLTMSHTYGYSPDGATVLPQPEEVFA